MVSTGVGEIEKDEGVLVIRRIHVTYRLKGVREEDRDKVERVHGFHADKCPVARSIGHSIGITTEVHYLDETVPHVKEAGR